MTITLIEIIGGAIIALLSAIIGMVWRKVDQAEKTARSNQISLQYLSASFDRTGQLTERLTSLESSVRVEIKNLSLNIRRLESMLIRLDNKDTQKGDM